MSKQTQQIAQQSEDGVEVETPDLHALATLTASEIDTQITTAKRYPRSLTGFRQQALEMVTLDTPTAQACIYALPRDNKVIEGPSARFAEVIVHCWGNNRHGARIVDIGEEYITAQGFFYDLEKNSAVTFEVLRRITSKNGHRYSADMIGVTGNAAAAIAHRNAVLKGIPKAFWSDMYERARQLVAGDVKSMVTRRDNLMKQFVIFGVTPPMIFGLLGVKGAEDISLEHLVTLGGIHTAIKEGDTTPEDAFSPDKIGETIIPPRPTTSEFKRDGATKKGGTRKAKTAKEPAAAKEEPKPTEPAADETPTERGKRLLLKQENAKDVADLRLSITDELETEEDKRAWDKLCDARAREVTKSAL